MTPETETPEQFIMQNPALDLLDGKGCDYLPMLASFFCKGNASIKSWLKCSWEPKVPPQSYPPNK